MRGAYRLALVVGLLGTACAAPQDRPTLEREVTRASNEVLSGRLRSGILELEALLPATLELPGEELRIEYYLTQAHLLASLRAPFLREPTTGLAADLSGEGSERQSPTAHMVALVYHAAAATALLDRYEGGEDRPLVEGNLALASATTFARMGFPDVARNATAVDPRLLSLDEFADVLETYDLPSELATWLAVMAFDVHKLADEQTAYRFAIHALEGAERYGHAPTDAEVARLERWILEGASVRFVCPESGTPYVPGVRRSPRSGVPHMEYVPVPRD